MLGFYFFPSLSNMHVARIGWSHSEDNGNDRVHVLMYENVAYWNFEITNFVLTTIETSQFNRTLSRSIQPRFRQIQLWRSIVVANYCKLCTHMSLIECLLEKQYVTYAAREDMLVSMYTLARMNMHIAHTSNISNCLRTLAWAIRHSEGIPFIIHYYYILDITVRFLLALLNNNILLYKWYNAFSHLLRARKTNPGSVSSVHRRRRHRIAMHHSIPHNIYIIFFECRWQSRQPGCVHMRVRILPVCEHERGRSLTNFMSHTYRKLDPGLTLSELPGRWRIRRYHRPPSFRRWTSMHNSALAQKEKYVTRLSYGF